MRYARMLHEGTPRWALLDSNTAYALESAPWAGENRPGPALGAVDQARLLAPAAPGKIICVGRNYAAHAAERGETVPTEPLLFFKPPSSVIGPGDPILLLPEMGRVEHEAELAVVIGRGGRFIAQADALDHVFGYTCANDVSERDYQARDGQWARAKGFDSFCPLGPWIETDLDHSHVEVSCLVNGELRQQGNTDLMVYAVPFLIGHISRIMTLDPGDLILTGTPAGVSPIRTGDTVEISVEGIGTLSNPVRMHG